jgi:hypothetical protein
MNNYTQRVRDSILPRSVGQTLPEAFEEWSVTERVIDHEQPIETCQLCGQESLRYEFEIKNSLNHNTMWVGSQCIHRFSLSVFEAGRKLSEADAKRKIDRMMAQMKQDCCITTLERLAAAEDNVILRNAVAYFKTKKYLTPKFAWVVLWRLRAQRIDHNPSFFKINLKREQYKADLRAMPHDRVHDIWPALTTSQRELAIRLGHSAPPAVPPTPAQ